MSTQQFDPNAILMGGGGAPTWKFPEPGTTKTGTIVAPPTARQETEYNQQNPGQPGNPKFFPSGDPIMGILVEVQTDERDSSLDDDEGKRTFYIEGKRLKNAVRDAVCQAGAPGLEVGGKLQVTLSHYDTPNDRKSGRNWQIIYTPGGNAALMDDEPTQAPQQQAPQQQAVPPQQAPQQQAPQQQAPQQQAQPASQGQVPATPQNMTPEMQAQWNAWMASNGQAPQG